MEHDKRWLNSEQLAEYLSVSLVALYHMISRGLLPYYKRGRRLLFYRDEIDDAMLELPKVEPKQARKARNTDFDW